ncbi:endonuclease/exonuclease/phosphatase family protein [Actinoplanes sp. NPDC000266]
MKPAGAPFPPQDLDGTSAARIRAVSYNLGAYRKTGARTRERQHELLRLLRADVLCLQEIYARGADLAELDRLVAAIDGALAMNAFAVPAVHSDCHLAILWRPTYRAISTRSYDLLMWHGLGIVRLDIGAPSPLTVAVTHLSPWNPAKQLDDTYTLTGKLPLSQPVLLGADWNSFGADPDYDRDPDWAALPPEWVERHVRWNDDPGAPREADRRPAQLMRRSGFHDAAPTLGIAWQATGGHRSMWSRREDVFWTTRPAALRDYQVINTETFQNLSGLSNDRLHTRGLDPQQLSDHLPVLIELDPTALTTPSDEEEPDA